MGGRSLGARSDRHQMRDANARTVAVIDALEHSDTDDVRHPVGDTLEHGDTDDVRHAIGDTVAVKELTAVITYARG